MMETPTTPMSTAVAPTARHTSPLVIGQPTRSTREFREGNTVLAYHGALLYESVVRGVNKDGDGRVVAYVLEYVGWMKSWNAVVDPAIVFEHTETNLRIAHQLVKNAKLRRDGQGGEPLPTPAPVPVSPGRQTPLQSSPYIAYPPPSVQPVTNMNVNIAAGGVHLAVQSSAPLPSISPVAVHRPLISYHDEQYPGMLEYPPSERIEIRHPSRTPFQIDSEQQQQQQEQLRSDPPASSVSHTPSPSQQYTPRQAYDPIEDAEDQMVQHNPHVELFKLPTALRQQLVDDWEMVTMERKLVSLPRSITVEHVLAKWLESREGGDRDDVQACEEVADGVRTYFNATLPTMLLYSWERPHHDAYFASEHIDPRPSRHYGAEHLCRLLLKLPFLLTANSENTGMCHMVLKKISERTNKLARFINENGRLFLLPVYDPAPSGYPERVQTTITPALDPRSHSSDPPPLSMMEQQHQTHSADNSPMVQQPTHSADNSPMVHQQTHSGDNSPYIDTHSHRTAAQVDNDNSPFIDSHSQRTAQVDNPLYFNLDSDSSRPNTQTHTPIPPPEPLPQLSPNAPRELPPQDPSPEASAEASSVRSVSFVPSIESEVDSSVGGRRTPNGRSPHSQRQCDTD